MHQCLGIRGDLLQQTQLSGSLSHTGKYARLGFHSVDLTQPLVMVTRAWWAVLLGALLPVAQVLGATVTLAPGLTLMYEKTNTSVNFKATYSGFAW